MTKAERPWRESLLHRLAKPAVTLPLDVSELPHAQLRRKLRRLLLGFVAAAFVALAVLFAALGVLPGFIDREVFTALDSDTELSLLALLFGLPLGTGLLLLLLVHRRVRRRPDEDDHPWRFQVTREGLTVTSARGRRLTGPWAEWHYAGYLYLMIKSSRLPTGLEIAHGDDRVRIEFSRFGRRPAGQLAAAVLQGLAAAGHSDR